MGWFKSAEEKAAEKRKEELIEKYGEYDGNRIFENKISEEKYLEKIKEEKKEKKETALEEERNRAAIRVSIEKAKRKRIKKRYKKEEKRISDIGLKIQNLLKEKSKKISISDIAAFLKEDRDEVKSILEDLHEEQKIDFAGNGRYFILTEDKEKPKTKATSSKKTDTTDVKAELEKYKQMLDEGLIEQADFDAKKKEILGL